MSTQGRAKDSAAAARLRESPQHKGTAVEGRKAARLRAFLAELSPRNTGSSKYRRLVQR